MIALNVNGNEGTITLTTASFLAREAVFATADDGPTSAFSLVVVAIVCEVLATMNSTVKSRVVYIGIQREANSAIGLIDSSCV